MAFNRKYVLDNLDKIKKDNEKYADFISLYCLSRGVKKANDWDRIMALTPINSVLNQVIDHLRKNTDFPHQIAFFGVLHYLAGFALTKGIHIDLDGQKIYPDIWNIILAPFGSGKSTVESFITKLFAEYEVKKVEPFATSAAYLESLSQTPKGILIKDEFAQLLANMEKQTYLAELKKYFLKTYDNADITRKTKKDTIEVEEPAISIYASTVDRTFKNYINEEMLLDGFAQRFNYVFCEERKNKKALLTHNANLEPIKEELEKTLENISHLKYRLSPKAIKEYEKRFHLNIKEFEGISHSFFRRTQFKTIKYALLYHFLLNKESEWIDEEDIKWGDRITLTHFVDLKKLLDMYEEDEIHNIIDKAVELKERLNSRNQDFTPRDLTKYLKGKVKNIAEAKLLHSLVLDIEKQKASPVESIF